MNGFGKIQRAHQGPENPVMLMTRMKSQALMNVFPTLGLALIQEIPL